MFTKPTNCPNSECRFRRGPEGAEKLYGTSRFYTKMGYFRRRSDRRAVPRYRCRACGKSFSSQADPQNMYWSETGNPGELELIPHDGGECVWAREEDKQPPDWRRLDLPG